MRMIERSSAFKRDYKRLKATPHHRKSLDSLLSTILECLLADEMLPDRNRDHSLSGEWDGYRECHIKPDKHTLRLSRLGSHSEPFG